MMMVYSRSWTSDKSILRILANSTLDFNSLWFDFNTCYKNKEFTYQNWWLWKLINVE